jgi:hypothetical protein
MGKPVITEAHVDRIVELGEAGKSDEFIVGRLKHEFGVNVSASAVHWHRIKHCAEPADRTRVPPVPTEPRIERRGDHIVRRFTQAEDAELLALEAQGLNDNQIGKRIGRRPNSVRGRLLILSRHADRRERAMAQAGERAP